jgi:hypothetical protein
VYGTFRSYESALGEELWQPPTYTTARDFK